MAARFKVLITDYAWPDLEIAREILSSVDADLIVAGDGDPATLECLAAGVDAIMTCWADVPQAVVAAAADCRIVLRFWDRL